MKRKMIGTAACLATVMLLAPGCMKKGDGAGSQALKELGKDEKATIKVMYYDETSFFQQFGNLFISKYPNVDIEVITNRNVYSGANTDYKKVFETFIEEQKPDILMLSLDQYETFASSGKLYGLDPVIKQDKYNLSTMLPGVLEQLRDKGGGALYGMSPTFSAQAMYYNKDLFDKYGVQHPRDKMSWDETFQLARRFPTTGDANQRIYGFYQNNRQGAFSLASQIGQTNGLSYVDPSTMKVTIHTDAWKKTVQTAVDVLKSGVVYQPSPNQNQMMAGTTFEDYLKQNLFIAGRAAMMVDYSYTLQNLQRAKDTLKDMPNWDLVTIPVDPQNPDVGSGMSLNQIFAVNAASGNPRAAWDFIKYVAGEDFARVIARSNMSGFPVRTSYLKDKDGHHLEAFYLLKPNSSTIYKDFDKLPPTFFQSFDSLATQLITSALEGTQTVDEALKNLQEKGQEAMIRAKQEQESAKDKAPQTGK